MQSQLHPLHVTRKSHQDWPWLVGCVWLILATLMTQYGWEDLAALSFSDNDDYMRLLQFTSWLEGGNWYLEPIPRFNPEDGQIMHWSRLADIPLAATLAVLDWLLPARLAMTLTLLLVPQLYLLATMLAAGLFAQRLTGSTLAAKVTALFVPLSPLLSPFLPGSIDHHNLQLVLLSACIAIIPLTTEECDEQWRAKAVALMMALSAWVGLENMPAFIAGLIILSWTGFRHDHAWLNWLTRMSWRLCALLALFMLLDRPVSEFMQPFHDKIGLPLLVMSLCAALFFLTLKKLSPRFDHNVTAGFVLPALICFLPFLALFPTFLLGPYHEFPAMLHTYWLDYVTEAMSSLDYWRALGFMNSYNYLVLWAAVALLPLFLPLTPLLRSIWLITTAGFAIPFFWQVRTISIVLLIALPLLTIACITLLSRLTRTPTGFWLCILALSPLCILSLQARLGGQQQQQQAAAELSPLQRLEPVLNRGLSQQNILAPLSYGAPLLALTDNAVSAAPYHRNVRGNLMVIDLLQQTDMQSAHEQISQQGFDYVLLGPDIATRVIADHAAPDALVKRLLARQPPAWLKPAGESQYGVLLYAVIKDEEGETP